MAKILVNTNGKALMNAEGKVYKAKENSTLKTLLDATKSCERMLENYQGESVEHLISYNDTENVTDFSNMYYDCKNATSFPQINTSNGTNFSNMYYGCSSATSFPQINTSNGTNFSNMYRGCSRATEFPQLDTSLGINFSYMFYTCIGIKKIDISYYKIASTNNCNYMCHTCYRLQAVIIRSFGDTYVLNSNSFTDAYCMLHKAHKTYNPDNVNNGYVYVPRNMISILQNTTNWSTLQFRALEDYTDDGTTTGKFLDEKAGLV